MEVIIDYYNKYKKNIYIAVVILLLIIMIGIGFYKSNSIVYASEVGLEEDLTYEQEDLIIESEINYIAIDIKGMVNNPGLYRLEEGSVVYDAIKASGGLLEDADTSVINLSKRLEDEMVIIIYSKDDINRIMLEDAYLEFSQTEIDQYLKDTYDELIRETLKIFVESNVVFDDVLENNEDEYLGEVLININTASIDELVLIPYIGTEKAKDIIEYRDENGFFESIEDIMNVSGIGEATFEKLKDSIMV